MSTPFFITGLPRTRSAWLAALFTTNRSLCFHEPDKPLTELLSCDEKLGFDDCPSPPDRYLGVSDSTLVFDFPAVCGQWPNSPWLFVERDAREAARSLIKFSAPTVRLLGKNIEQVFSAHHFASQAVIVHKRTLLVPYDQLDARIKEVWTHLLPELPFDRERYRILEGFKIEQRLEQAFARKKGRRILVERPRVVDREQLQRFHD